MLTPILMYHEVGGPGELSEDAYASWTITPQRFAEHLAMLAGAGYSGVSVAEWLEHRREASPRGKCVVITFDDGFRGNVEHAVPALLERGWSATFFVISGKMDTPGYAGARDWRAAAEAGMDVASHTATHPFTGALPLPDVRKELLDSRLALEDAIKRPVSGFSWPNGDAPRGGRAVLGECGYRWAATSRAAFATAESDPLALPRLAVRSWHTADGLAGLVDTSLRHRLRLGLVGGAKRVARAILGRERYARLQMRVMD